MVSIDDVLKHLEREGRLEAPFRLTHDDRKAILGIEDYVRDPRSHAFDFYGEGSLGGAPEGSLVIWPGITSIAGVERLPRFVNLSFRGYIAFDLSELAENELLHENITQFNYRGSHEIIAHEPLSNYSEPIQAMIEEGTRKAADISFLGKFRNLTYLNFRECFYVTDFSVLGGEQFKQKVESLNLSSTNPNYISFLRGYTSLKQLDLSYLHSLREKTETANIISKNNMDPSYFEPLADPSLARTVTNLNLRYTNFANLEFLKEYQSLEKLDCYKADVSDIEALVDSFASVENGRLKEINLIHSNVDLNDQRNNDIVDELRARGIKVNIEDTFAYDDSDDFLGLAALRKNLKREFPESYERIYEAIDSEVIRIQNITQNTTCGVTGGGVGRVIVVENDMLRRLVFRVQKDAVSAYKAVGIPIKIHERAETDKYAGLLAKRTPKAFLDRPAYVDGYWITVAEEFTGNLISYSKEDLKIIGPELTKAMRKGLDLGIMDHLYTKVLYQKVMTDIYDGEKRKDGKEPLIVSPGVWPTNLEKGQVIERMKKHPSIYEQIKSEFLKMLEGYDDDVAELAASEINGRIVQHGDDKDDNNKNGAKYDYDLTKLADGVDDQGRQFMNKPEVFKDPRVFHDYMDSFFAMAERVGLDYGFAYDFKRLVLMQTKKDAQRNLGWVLDQGKEEEFRKQWETARLIHSAGRDLLCYRATG